MFLNESTGAAVSLLPPLSIFITPAPSILNYFWHCRWEGASASPLGEMRISLFSSARACPRIWTKEATSSDRPSLTLIIILVSIAVMAKTRFSDRRPHNTLLHCG